MCVGGAGAGEGASKCWMSTGYEQWGVCLFVVSMGVRKSGNGDVQ